MRNSIYAIVLTAFMSVAPLFSVDAQNYFNIKLGTALYDQSNAGGSFKLGFLAGASYEPKIANHLWLEFGATYVEKGSNLGTIANVTQFTTRLQYIDIPLFAKYTYELRNHFTWAVYAGPSLGFAIGARNRFFTIGQPQVIDIPIGGPDGVNSTDFALNLGGELNFRTAYGYATLFAEFQQGISTVLTTLNGNDIRNVGINLGLKLKVGRKTDIAQDPIDLNRL